MDRGEFPKTNVEKIKHPRKDKHKYISLRYYVAIAQNIILCKCVRFLHFLSNIVTTRTLTKSNDNYYKGMPRSYVEAKSLHVIDRGVEHLVDVMNYEPLIRTIGSCQGHGHIFIKVPPYVSFKSNINVASALATALLDAYNQPSRKLNYSWELSACFDSNSELTYVIQVPGISSGKWFYATRRGIDQDFELISLLVQEVLNHFKSKNIKMKCKPDTPHQNKQSKH